MEFDLENEKIKLEKNGKIIDCDILFTFDCDDTNKSYVGYTDNSLAYNGRKNIFVSSYDPLDITAKLEDITDPKELEMINHVLEEIDNG